MSLTQIWLQNFFEHFVLIADAMNAMTEKKGLWHQSDGFYYDKLSDAKGYETPIRVRSLVGLSPLMAVAVIPKSQMDHPKLAGFKKRTLWFLDHRKDLSQQIELLAQQTCSKSKGSHDLYLLSIPKKERLRSVFKYLCDEAEFLSDYGIRSLSKYHKQNPYVLSMGGTIYKVAYVPGESDSCLFGGNSNWRGPVWMPMNILLAESLRRVDNFYKNDLLMEYPVGTGRMVRPHVATLDIYERIISLFLPDYRGKRPCHGDDDIFNTDPHWKNLIYFYEYFHADSGRGLGASHQTGWTACVANLVFEVATAREYYKTILTLEGQQFLDANLKTFNRKYWIKMNEYECYEIKECFRKSTYKTLADLMEALYQNANWKYQNLLVRHALSVYGTNIKEPQLVKKYKT